jgi:hypothetical protein
MKAIIALIICSFLAFGTVTQVVQAKESATSELSGKVKSIDGQYSFVELAKGKTVLTYSEVPLPADMVGKSVTLAVKKVGDIFMIEEVTSVSPNK